MPPTPTATDTQNTRIAHQGRKEQDMMTFEEFYSAYRKHDGEKPIKLPRKHDGYELRYQNGDTYVFDMELIPGRLPDWNGNHSADHYIYRSTWNGRPITR